MHTPIQAREVSQEVEGSGIAVYEWVVQPDLDVGMGLKNGERRIDALGIQVVEQQPYPHAPLGGPP